MIYSLFGKLILKKPAFAVIETGVIAFKVFTSPKTWRQLPKIGSKTKLFTYFYTYQNGSLIYGFVDEKEKEIFELLTSVNGIGPKAALKIIGSMRLSNLLSAVKH